LLTDRLLPLAESANFSARVAVAQSGRAVDKLKARTNRQLQNILPFIFLAGLNRRYFQQIQPPQRLFIFGQPGAAAKLNT
jgi:hypothetical protein